MANNNNEKGLIPKYILDDIANAIRSKLTGQNKYKPGAMAEAIRSISDAYFDSNDEFYILSPEYWTINVDNKLEHQEISYTTSTRTDSKDSKSIAPKLVILPSIKSNAGYMPGIINKTIDYENHTITFSAGSVTPIDGFLEDGVLHVYVKSGNDNLYRTMTVTHDDATNTDRYTFSDPITAKIDSAIRVVGTDSSTWTQRMDSDSKYLSSTGFEADCISIYNDDGWGISIFSRNTNKFEYFKMPNLVDFEHRWTWNDDRILSEVSSLKTVDFRNLEYINNSYDNKENSQLCFCVNDSSLTNINFSNLKLAYCDLLSSSAITEINLEKLEKVVRMTSFPNATVITLPLLNTVYKTFLCNCPKLVNASFPELTTVRGNLLNDNVLLETVDCPKLTTANGDNTLCNCPKLTNVSLPELTTVKGNLLDTNTNITELNLPNLETVGGILVKSNNLLETVNCPKLTTVGNTAICNCSRLTNISLPELTTVNGDTLSYCPKITSISLPELTTVGGNFLNESTLLESVECPKLTTLNGRYNLGNCHKIVSASFPELTTVNGDLLAYNNLLKTVSLPKLTTANGDNTLCSCPKLTNVSLPELTTVRGNFLRTNDLLETVDCPKLTTANGNYTITGSHKLVNISLPELTTVKGNFLNANDLLETVDFPKLTTANGDYTLCSCPKLTNVSLPELTTVKGSFLKDNDLLETVDCPKLRSVGGDLFRQYNGTISPLKSVNLPLLETVGGRLFDRNSIKTLVLPKLTIVNEDFCDRQNELIYIDFGALGIVKGDFIWNCPNIKTIIIRTESVPYIGESICNQKPADCILYVPDDMIAKYLADSKWSAAFDSDHIKSISEAPQPPADE